MSLWEIENNLFDNGYKLVAGVDEAGRGSLAGPVFAASVILPEKIEIEELGDSKTIRPKMRDILYDIIIEKAVAYGIGYATAEEIDANNILNATYMAMNRAISDLIIKPDICIIDGNRSEGIKYNNICVVKADSKSASVAAASILAKVTRDRYMINLSNKFPEYEFQQHKGYGTKLHYEKLSIYGPSPIHRKSFMKNLK